VFNCGFFEQIPQKSSLISETTVHNGVSRSLSMKTHVVVNRNQLTAQ